MEDFTYPCPNCGVEVSAKAAWCSGCRDSLLVDLRTSYELEDTRKVYFAARALASIPLQPHDFPTLRYRLEDSPGILVSSVTPIVATACRQSLKEFGIEAHAVRRTQRSESRTQVVAKKPFSIPQRMLRFAGRWSSAIVLTVLVVALAGVLVGLRARASSESRAASSMPISVVELKLLVARGVVEMRCRNNYGAGFFVDDGIVVGEAAATCSEIPTVELRFGDGQTAQGRAAQTAYGFGIAVVRTKGAIGTPLALADTSSLQNGDEIYFVDGSSEGFASLAAGRILDVNRPVMGASYLQFDAGRALPLEGGPLIDGFGRVVGAVTDMVERSENLRLALPANYLVVGDPWPLVDVDAPVDRERWLARAAAAATTGGVGSADAIRSRTALVGARGKAGGGVTAFLVRVADSAPPTGFASFTFQKRGVEVCTASGSAADWRRLTEGAIVPWDSRVVHWLAQRKLLHTGFGASVELDLSRCPDPAQLAGSTVILGDGAEHADRVRLQF